ncbi:hypothetical protein CPB83DRAFT_900019 [Crepidotus variabilis]|uniref:DNA-directed RNA polymerase n=1 Tax=Crepidotus variabilis TaxID=179855 RepID=A0A9P6JI40_9AGAR|nr:hypothetical protein CPB83DRAFT_900019 [Crepidotus variabilis]
MSFITQTIAARKGDVAKIIDDATYNRLKASPGMTIRESFESKIERELNLARDKSEPAGIVGRLMNSGSDWFSSRTSRQYHAELLYTSKSIVEPAIQTTLDIFH